MDDRARTLYLGERTIFRSGLLRLPHDPRLRDDDADRHRAVRGGIEARRPARLRLRARQLPHTLPAWLHQKLMEPRIFDRDKEKLPEDLLRMPKFHFTSEEADAPRHRGPLLDQGEGARPPPSGSSPRTRASWSGAGVWSGTTTAGAATHRRPGRQHPDGEGQPSRGAAQEEVFGDLRPRRAAPQAVALSPPMLYNEKSRIGEGARVQSPWLHEFLKDPSDRVRPWLQVRMPTFGFSEPAAQRDHPLLRVPGPRALPLRAQGRRDPRCRPRRGLFEKWQCVKCHVVAGKLPNQPPGTWPPTSRRSRPAAPRLDRPG